MAVFTFRTIAMVAVLGAALVIAAVVLLVRGDNNAPIGVVIPTLESRLADSALPPALLSISEVKAYTSGAVRDLGVYQLEQGNRLVDALKAVGSVKEDGMLDVVNPSLRVLDEGHYHIPRPGETSPAAPALSVPAI